MTVFVLAGNIQFIKGILKALAAKYGWHSPTKEVKC